MTVNRRQLLYDAPRVYITADLASAARGRPYNVSGIGIISAA